MAKKNLTLDLHVTVCEDGHLRADARGDGPTGSLKLDFLRTDLLDAKPGDVLKVTLGDAVTPEPTPEPVAPTRAHKDALKAKDKAEKAKG